MGELWSCNVTWGARPLVLKYEYNFIHKFHILQLFVCPNVKTTGSVWLPINATVQIIFLGHSVNSKINHV